MSTDSTTERLVWDLPLRVFHWLLAASLVASYVTARIGYDVRQYHMWLGYWMIGLLTFRLAWGFLGTRHSRFGSFLPRPAQVAAHLRETLTGAEKPTAGHNPVGSLMVFAVLILLAMQALSGLFMDDDIYYAGPYANAVSEQLRDVMAFLHHNVINVILALAAIHILAVCYFSLYRKQRLIRAMFTGRKSSDVVPAEEAIRDSRLWVAAVIAIAVFGAIFWLGWP